MPPPNKVLIPFCVQFREDLPHQNRFFGSWKERGKSTYVNFLRIEAILGHKKKQKNAKNLPKNKSQPVFQNWGYIRPWKDAKKCPKFTENPKVNKFPKISYVLVSLCSTQLSTLIELAAVFHRLDLVRFQPSIWFVCKTVFKQSLVGLQDRAFGWFARHFLGFDSLASSSEAAAVAGDGWRHQESQTLIINVNLWRRQVTQSFLPQRC